MALHHIGFVVGSIEKVVDRFGRSISAQWDGLIFADPLQEVRVTFLRSTAAPNESLIELVEPVGDKSPVQNFLKRGGGLHHLCYEVDSLAAQLQLSRSIGGLVVRQPMPAVAFGGRQIAWVYTADKLLTEYLART
jgi:methylmalonyl-CoA/ethylmalonyl-CoA epimerase